MMQIVLLIMIISTLIGIVNKSNTTTYLSCGIWLYHGDNKKSKWNWSKFDLLGVMNDERGGDANGRYSGRELEHSNDIKNRKYKDYIKLNYPPSISKESTTIIGHARKSSSYHGSNNNLGYTQPIARWNDDYTKINGILVHNGTLYNTDELIEKYKISKKINYRIGDNNENVVEELDTNDSHILADILLVKKDFDVLKDYRGTASLVWYDATQNKLFVWAGESKFYEHGNASEERPLYSLNGEDHLWVSSLEDPLGWIRHQSELDVEEVPKNTIQVFQNGRLIEQIPVDRSSQSQTSHYKPNETKRNYNKSKFDFYSDDEEERRYGYYGYDDAASPIVIYNGEDQCLTCGGTGDNPSAPSSRCFVCSGTGQQQKEQRSIGFKQSSPISIAKEKESATNSSLLLGEPVPYYKNQIIKFSRLRYYFEQRLAHGELNITRNGQVKEYESQATTQFAATQKYYFIKGIMMKNEEAYANWRHIVLEVDEDVDDLQGILKDSQYPVCAMEYEWVMGESYDKNGVEDYAAFTGTIYPKFSRNIYKFEKGSLSGITPSGAGLNMPYFETKKEKTSVITPSTTPKESIKSLTLYGSEDGHLNSNLMEQYANKQAEKTRREKQRERIKAKQEQQFCDEQKEVDNQTLTALLSTIGNVLISINDAKSECSDHMTNIMGKSTYDLLGKIENEINKHTNNMNDILPF